METFDEFAARMKRRHRREMLIIGIALAVQLAAFLFSLWRAVT